LVSDVLYEIEPDGYKPIDLKFSVDSSAGLQLFMGNRLYAGKRVFLRELIQTRSMPAITGSYLTMTIRRPLRSSSTTMSAP
jgi:hypothetical protein